MTTDKPKSKKPRGRPAGRGNITATADVTPSRCPKCQSSRRGAYRKTYERRFGAGTNPAGMIYRRTQCLDCGQQRIDREPIFDATPPAAATEAYERADFADLDVDGDETDKR